WDKAGLFAADLGHYVADGHMPLHITMNYNGQHTGNTGIHSRYESTMINAYISQINYMGHQISVIPDVNEYIFTYLYANYVYVDSVLLADDFAKEMSGGSTSSPVYKQALWDKTKGFTIPLFSFASKRLAELIYTAWVEAGKPEINTSGIEKFPENGFVLELNYPNPFSNSTNIHFSLEKNSSVELIVYDATGRVITQLENDTLPKGEYQYQWDASNFSEGLYFLVLSSSDFREIRKMVVAR
ncbi:MAG TPA: T9SS type A sorting domain-containing protein, partial [Bacteroidales bacterium]